MLVANVSDCRSPQIVASHDFDPRTGITAAPDAGWHGATDKPKLHEFLRTYFAARREDG